jgi:hypothetical protein
VQILPAQIIYKGGSMNNLGYLATIAGVDFYEHPEFGDEAPVQYMLDGKLCDTPFWDLQDPEEIKDWILSQYKLWGYVDE